MKIVNLNPNYRNHSPAYPLQGEQAAYTAALRLVIQIDAGLESRRIHYRDCQGRLLTCLDEVVNAILSNELLLSEPGAVPVAAQPELERAA